MRYVKYLFCYFFIFSLMITSTMAQSFEVIHYNLKLNVDPENKRIDGSNKMTLRCNNDLDRITFQLSPLLEIKSIHLENTELDFTRSNNDVTVKFVDPLLQSQQISFTVAYEGNPQEAERPPWKGGVIWSKSKNGSHWIGTSCQVQGASLWWPSFEDWSQEPDSISLSFTVPSNLICVSNGVLKERIDKGDVSTFIWKSNYPINPYGVTMNIGRFELVEHSYKSISGKEFPIQLYYLSENKANATKFFPQIKEQMQFLESKLGPYPFADDKYAVVEAPYTGMEHQTIISIDTLYRENYAKFNWLHFHELSHEWFGNMITSSWQDFWIHEGFATFMEALYVENLIGVKHYCRFINSYYSRMLNEEAIAYKSKISGEQAFFIADSDKNNRDFSLKGAYFIHLLRMELGEEKFNSFLSESTLKETNLRDRFRQINTLDMLNLANKYAEKDLSDMFEQILYESSVPDKYTFDEESCNLILNARSEREK